MFTFPSFLRPTAHLTPVRGMLIGGTRGAARLASNILQVGAIHIGTALAIRHAWIHGFSWIDLSALLIFFALGAIGIVVGAHRYFAHRSFTAPRWFVAVLAILANTAMQGSVGRWTADHMRHHAYPDQAGDPHSPLVDSDGTRLTGWRAYFHAHIGWLFTTETTDHNVFGKAVWADPMIRFLSNTSYVWIGFGWFLAWGYGYLLGGPEAAIGALLWGGFARAFIFSHAVFCLAYTSHSYGEQPFGIDSDAKNGPILSWLTLGESWHNNHHKFPRSARLGLFPGQFDLAAEVIEFFEKIGLVRDVVRISDDTIRRQLTGTREAVTRPREA